MDSELAIVIEDPDREKNEGVESESQPNTASSSQVRMNGGTLPSSALGNGEIDSRASSSSEREANEIQETTEEIQQQQEREPYLGVTWNRIRDKYHHMCNVARNQGLSSSASIFRLPQRLVGNAEEDPFPELVSIGPYHHGKDKLRKFEPHKWVFMGKFFEGKWHSFPHCLSEMRELEEQTRRCYSDIETPIDSHDFVEMMLIDGCFIIGLLRHLGRSEVRTEEINDPIFARPWLISVLIKDILKLENQLPFFVLKFLFELSKDPGETKMNDLPTLALEVFDLTFPWPKEIPSCTELVNIKHLLHLFYLSHLPPCPFASFPDLDPCRRTSSITSIQCATQLKASGIKFKTKKANSFLDIEFKNWVLEIPTINVNNFTSTLLLNCVAFEQCKEEKFRYFTDYVCFMNSLIKQPADVASLCSDGIITSFSDGDRYVADLFNDLAMSVDFNVRNCYLSQQFRDVESFYSSHRATMMRTYFRTPWSVISVFSAFLVIFLTLIQTIMSILSYVNKKG